VPESTAADLVFTGGCVYTVDPSQPHAQAVAVRGGRIVAVGTDAQMRPHVGPRTEVVNLRGRMLLPGFSDAHVHPPQGGLERIRCDLTGGATLPEYLDRIGAYATANPDAAWILGGGWSMTAFPGGVPVKEPLDALTAGRPVFLPGRDHHSAWVNSRALEIAGITRDTPDPPGGRIERDAAGEPTGALHESAIALAERFTPPTDHAELRRGLLVAQEYLHSLGITSWQDAWVGTGPSIPDSYDVYLDLASAGLLTARVVGALWWDRDRAEEQLAELLERRARGGIGRFQPTSVKIMQDGVCEVFTAAMLWPYLDADGHETDNRGLSFIDPDDLNRYVTSLDAAGFQVHIHALGDRGVREALDAVAAARRANGRNDLRHHLAHLQVVHPDDRARFAELDVVATVQPLWACLEPAMTDLTIPFLGPQRAGWQYPFRALADAGARLACGSDWPVSTPDVMAQLHVAVNRVEPHGDQEAFLPEQRLSLPAALHAFTVGSAYVNHLDAETGSIEVGKYADLVVLDRDLFQAGPGALADATVQLTLVEGEPVFAVPSGV
jgi:hypothetical protein